MYAFVRTLWDEPAALVAAALYAAVPANQDILGWHGLANVAALALLPLFLLYLGELVTRGLRTSACAGLGLVVIAVAAAHRLTFTVLVLTAVVVLAVALALARERAALLRGAALATGFAALLSAGVAYDLVTRGRTFGGTLSYTAYLGSKVELGPAIADLTVPFAVLGLMALGFGVRRLPGDRRALPLLALAVVSVGLAFAWVVHLPLFYVRLVVLSAARPGPARRGRRSSSCSVPAGAPWSGPPSRSPWRRSPGRRPTACATSTRSPTTHPCEGWTP